MKKFLTLCLLLCSLTAAAQEIQMVVTVKDGGVQTVDGTVSLPAGELIFPLDAFKSIEYRLVEKPVIEIEGLRAVDMGLSVKWANINFGAKDSTEVGTPLVFGDLEKVQAEWGEKWRVPTKKEVQELIGCTWELVYDDDDNIIGFKVSGKNGTGSLYFPVTKGYTTTSDNSRRSSSGYTYYWTATDHAALELSPDEPDVRTAINAMNKKNVETFLIAVRPVYSDEVVVEKSVTLMSTVKVESTTATATVTFDGDYTDITSYGIKGNSAVAVTKSGCPAATTETFSWKNLAAGTYSFLPFAIIGEKEFTGDLQTFTVEEQQKPEDGDTLVVNEKFPVAGKVDMGLSVMWSSWNMGASQIADYGKLIGWGDETGELESNNSGLYGVDTSDYANIGATENDVAHVQWGNKWRLPTKADFEELVSKCKYEYVDGYVVDGVNTGIIGWKFYEYGKEKGEGNSIFIPLSGYRNPGVNGDNVGIRDRNDVGVYWTSEKDQYKSNPWAKPMTKPKEDFQMQDRVLHFSIRPVYDSSITNDNPGNDEPGPDNPVNPDYLFKSDEAGTVMSTGVDLGLPSGRKWAKWNIGANSETEYGHYYAWGDTLHRESYDRAAYAENVAIYNGVDGLTFKVLDDSQDAAQKIWKNGWRMPTMDDYTELLLYTKSEWDKVNGVMGYKFTSTQPGYTSKYVFFPASGRKTNTDVEYDGFYGYYWTNKANDGSDDGKRKTYAVDLQFGHDYTPSFPGLNRYRGCSVRPIHD